MSKNTPRPWRYQHEGVCAKTGEDFGNIYAANGVEVAENVYQSDAEAIIAQPEAVPADAKDAARYRYLRSGNERTPFTLGIWKDYGEGIEDGYPNAGEVDALVDAAMTEEVSKPQHDSSSAAEGKA